MKISLLILAVLAVSMRPAHAAADQADSEAVRIGPGVTAPKLTSKIEPKYTRAALDAHIQGTILLEIIIDKSGVPRDISVLSPVGFGLDERAVECVSEWRFKPGMKEGHPVNTRAQVEVNFRLLGMSFDQKAEDRRTRFNAIAARLKKGPDGKPTDRDLADLQELAKNKLPAAQYVIGSWEIDGDYMPKDVAAGLANIQKAADQNYGPALFFIGQSKVQGTLLPKEPSKGLSMMQDAAVLGSKQAQFTLGDMYEKGNGVESDRDRAKRYFRLCAASGTPECQYRLATLLLRSDQRTEQDEIQAVAWLELAKDHDLSAAKAAANSAAAKLTPGQADLVARLKPQLERKP
jgi:TonB family protein